MTETTTRFDFRDLFVLDLANNHQGSVAHGKAIVDACAEVDDGSHAKALDIMRLYAPLVEVVTLAEILAEPARPGEAPVSPSR